MKTRLSSLFVYLTLFLLTALTGCTTISDIVPQLPFPKAANSSKPVGQDITQANNLLNAGRKREAAGAYFLAAQQYASPQRERLILQAAELASIIKDPALTQTYLQSINFDRLNTEYQARFRLIQGQLALNDRNYREALRILPQSIKGIPESLGQKILNIRMQTAQSSGDKIALIQELVLQEPSLKKAHLVTLNHDRIWNHAQQIPTFQLNQAQSNLQNPLLKNWLSLAQLSRIAKYGTVSNKQTVRSQLGSWIQNNPNHPGMQKALGLLNATPTTIVTPYTNTVKTVIKP